MAGKGASTKGGRWNAVGQAVTYASTSISLAAWETRAHLGPAGVQLPLNRFLVRIDVPEDVWNARAHFAMPLPVGWDVIPEGSVSRQLGSKWLNGAATALFVVPSVIISEEINVLINPAHAHSQRLRATKVRRFLYDPRV